MENRYGSVQDLQNRAPQPVAARPLHRLAAARRDHLVAAEAQGRHGGQEVGLSGSGPSALDEDEGAVGIRNRRPLARTDLPATALVDQAGIPGERSLEHSPRRRFVGGAGGQDLPGEPDAVHGAIGLAEQAHRSFGCK